EVLTPPDCYSETRELLESFGSSRVLVSENRRHLREAQGIARVFLLDSSVRSGFLPFPPISARCRPGAFRHDVPLAELGSNTARARVGSAIGSPLGARAQSRQARFVGNRIRAARFGGRCGIHQRPLGTLGMDK